MTGIVLTALACYLGGTVIGALIFVGIGCHIINKDNEFHQFIADINTAHEKGEL